MCGFAHSDYDKVNYFDVRSPWYGNKYVNGDNTTGNPSAYAVRNSHKLKMDENLLFIVDGEYFYVKMGGNSRNGLVLDTKKGRIPFYRSSGKSEESKEEGEWTIFKGYQPFSYNFAHIRKTRATFNLTQGKDKYLTILCLVLGHLWDNKQLINQLNRIDFYEMSNRRLNQINQKIKQLNQQEDKDRKSTRLNSSH